MPSKSTFGPARYCTCMQPSNPVQYDPMGVRCSAETGRLRIRLGFGMTQPTPKRAPFKFAAVSRPRLDVVLRNFTDFLRNNEVSGCEHARRVLVNSSRENSSGCRASPFFENQFFVVATTSQHLSRRQSKISTYHVLMRRLTATNRDRAIF